MQRQSICFPVIPLFSTRRARRTSRGSQDCACYDAPSAMHELRPLTLSWNRGQAHARGPRTKRPGEPTATSQEEGVEGRGVLVAIGQQDDARAGSREQPVARRARSGSRARRSDHWGDPAGGGRAGSRLQRCACAARGAPHHGGSRGEALRPERGDSRRPDSAGLGEPGAGRRRRIARGGAGPGRRQSAEGDFGQDRRPVRRRGEVQRAHAVPPHAAVGMGHRLRPRRTRPRGRELRAGRRCAAPRESDVRRYGTTGSSAEPRWVGKRPTANQWRGSTPKCRAIVWTRTPRSCISASAAISLVKRGRRGGVAGGNAA